jgi:molecular chaperone DnaK (HSP70)
MPLNFDRMFVSNPRSISLHLFIMTITPAIDFGNENTVICLPASNGIEILVNPDAGRVTPTMVTFGDDRRFWGGAAEREQMRYTSGTVAHLKKLIGLPFSSPTRASIAAEIGATLAPLDNGLTGIELNFRNEKFILRPEQVLAYFMKNIASLATARDSRSKGCVITASPAWNDKQRRLVADAFKIAGQPPLAMVNSTTAAAAAYAMRHRNQLPLKESLPVLFLDFGSSALTAAAARLKKGTVEVLASAVDPQLGGSEFTSTFTDYLLAKVRANYKTDPAASPRALIRFRRAAEKVKKNLSVNPVVNFEVQGLPGDVDVSFFVRREEFVSQISDRLDNIAQLINRTLDLARLTLADIQVIEILGGGSRIPAIREKVAALCGREPKQTLENECFASGAAYIAAIMSPAFRISLTVQDVLSIPITAQWGEECTTVFDRLTVLPASTGITVKGSGTFAVSIFSGPEEVGRLTINTESDSPVDLLVRFRLSVSSIVEIDGVFADKRAISHTVEWAGQASPESLQAMADAEEVMAAFDRAELLIDDAKNALESAIFALEAELRDSPAFFSPAEKEGAARLLAEMRAWADATEFDRLGLEEYRTRLALVRACAAPIARRRRNWEKRSALKQRLAALSTTAPDDRRFQQKLREIGAALPRQKWDDGADLDALSRAADDAQPRRSRASPRRPASQSAARHS